MGELEFDLSGLSPRSQEDALKHLQQTYNVSYASLDRVTENYFRQPPGSVVTQAPPAAALREIIAQLRSGKPVRLRLSSLGKSDRVRLSQLLEQTARRAYRDDNQELGQALRQVWAEFDRQFKVPQDELERAEWAALEAAQREAELAKRENARSKRSRVVA